MLRSTRANPKKILKPVLESIFNLKMWVRITLTLLSGMVLHGPAHADSLELHNISEADLKAVVNDFSANFAFTTVSGAGSLGKIFGAEVGVIVGTSQSPNLDNLAQESNSSSSMGTLAHGGLVGIVSVPFGITGEVMMIPKMNMPDGHFSNTGLGVKWTITDTLLPIPMIDLAVRASMTKTKFEYSQPVSNVDTDVTFDDSQTAIQFLVGIDLPIIKPYIGVGTVTAEGEMGISGANTIFNFTSSTKASSKVTSSQMIVGAEVRLLLIKFGFEYSKMFDTSRYTGKLSLAF